MAWADRFRVSSEPSEETPQSWALTVYRRSRFLDLLATPFEQMMRWSYYWHPPSFGLKAAVKDVDSRVADIIWYTLVGLLTVFAGWRIYLVFAHADFGWNDAATALGYGFITLVRVMVLIGLASLVWTPVGIMSASGPASPPSSSRWPSSWPPSPTIFCFRWWCR